MRAGEALAAVETLADGSEFVVRPSTVYSRAERRCSRPGCITILSRYNGSHECFVHQDQLADELYRRRHPEAEAA